MYYDSYPDPNQASFGQSRGWWEAPETDDEQEQSDRARSLYDHVRGLENSQRSAHEQNLWNARLYSNRELCAFDWGHGVFYNASLTPVSLLGENLVLSVVDTLVSLVGKNRTKVTPVPRGASFKTQRNCRKLDKWLYGEFVRLDIFKVCKRVFRDACVFGFGAVRVGLDESDKLCVRRVFPDDLIIDQSEASNGGQVMHVYERRCRRVEEVAAEYGVDVADIMPATNYLPYRQPGKGWCVVVEGIRCARKGHPGRRVVATDGGILLVDEKWKHEYHPFVWFHANEPLSGFYWPSIVEQVLPYQIRLNEINEVIRDAQDLMARPRIFVSEGSRVTPTDLDNKIGRIIKYTGVMPEAVTWEAVGAELYGERDREVRTCFEQFGLPQIVAQGRLPQGARLDSAPAMQEATSMPDDRLTDMTQRFEEFHMDLGEAMIRAMKTGGGRGGADYETVWYSGGKKGRAETIKWSEIDLDADAYVMTLEPASVFSMTPAARRDKVERLFDKQLITAEQYWAFDQNPDIENTVSLKSAACDDIRRVVELLEDGEYEAPHPAQDLVYGVETVTQAYLRLSNYEDVDPVVKDNFLKWIAMAKAVLELGTQTPEQGSPNSMAPMPPPSPGAMPPTPMPPLGIPQSMGMMPPPGMLPPGGGMPPRM